MYYKRVMCSRFRRPSGHFLYLLACTLLILCGGMITAGAYIFVQHRVTSRTNHAFEALTNSYASQLSRQMERYGDILYASRALFAATEVDANTWRQFIYAQNAPERYAGMKSVAYAQIVPNQAAAAYQKMLQETQDASIRIHPQKAAGDYVVVTYHEQADAIGQSAKALGFDVPSEAARQQALARAQTTGRIVATAPIRLVTDGRPGFLLLLPLTSRAGAQDTTTAYGYSIAAFDAAEMIGSILSKDLEKDQSSVTITDVTDGMDQQLYSKSHGTWQRTVKRAVIVHVADRKWQLAFETPTSSIVMLGDRLAPTIVLVSGIAFILLIGVLAYVLRRRSDSLAV